MSEENTINYWLAKAYEAIHEAEKIADKTGEEFSFSVSYGMGGYYYPKKKPPLTREDAIALLRNGRDLTEDEKEQIKTGLLNDFQSDDEDDWDSSNEGWMASSQSC